MKTIQCSYKNKLHHRKDKTLNSSTCFSILREVQILSKTAHTHPFSWKKYHTLSRQLNEIFDILQHTGAPSYLFTQYLKELCIDLYQKLEDGLLEMKIAQIQKTAETLFKDKVSIVAIKTLEKKIRAVLQAHAPSREQRQILIGVEQRLKAARTKKSPPPLAPTQEMGLLSEIEDVLEIAKAIHEKELYQAQQKYQTLSELLQWRIQTHLSVLKGVLFVDRIKTIQALMATANVLAANGALYPTLEEINTFFYELHQITVEGEKEGASACFTSAMM